MRTLYTILVVLVLVSMVYPCDGDGKFRRCDANCDTELDISDVQLLCGSNYEFPDAADCDDDGTLSPTTDCIYLSNWLFNQGPPPPPPLAFIGPDCTVDAISPCYSQQNGDVDGPVAFEWLAVDTFLIWNEAEQETWPSFTTTGADDGFLSSVFGFDLSCPLGSDPTRANGFVADMSYLGRFRSGEVRSGALRIVFTATLDIEFFTGAACSQRPCSDEQTIRVDLSDVVAFFGAYDPADPVNTFFDFEHRGGASEWGFASQDEHIDFRMQTNASCVVSHPDPATDSVTLTWDITDDILADEDFQQSADCDLWGFVVENQFDSGVWFLSDDSTAIRPLSVEIDYTPKVEFVWCN